MWCVTRAREHARGRRYVSRENEVACPFRERPNLFIAAPEQGTVFRYRLFLSLPSSSPFPPLGLIAGRVGRTEFPGEPMRSETCTMDFLPGS